MKREANSWDLAQWTLLNTIRGEEIYTVDSVQKKLFTQLGSGKFSELLQGLIDANAVELIDREEEVEGIKITPKGNELMEELSYSIGNQYPLSLTGQWLRKGDILREADNELVVEDENQVILRTASGELQTLTRTAIAKNISLGKLSHSAILQCNRYACARDWWNTLVAVKLADQIELPLEDISPEVVDMEYEDLPSSYQGVITDVYENEILEYAKEDPFPTDLRPELVVPAPEPSLMPGSNPIPPIMQDDPSIDPFPTELRPELVTPMVDLPVPNLEQCPICKDEGTIQGCPLCHKQKVQENPSRILQVDLPDTQDLQVMQTLDDFAETLESVGELEDAKLIDEAVQDFQIASFEKE